jgi:hypothetical protein
MFSKTMKIFETPDKILIEKITIPDPLWIILFPLCILFSIASITIPHYFIGNYYSLVAVVLSCCLAILFPILYIRWNYFSEYPATVHISHGHISIRFRRLLRADQVIEVNSQCNPTLVSDCFTHYTGSWGSHYYYARVQLESTLLRTYVIYIMLASTEEEATYGARQFAKNVSTRTEFILRK